MLSTLSVLIIYKSIHVLGALSNVKGISVSLYERNFPLAKDGVFIPDAPLPQASLVVEKYSVSSTNTTSNTKASKSSTSLFKRHNAPLERKGNGMIWTAQIGIGTPPQLFKVVIDTGSAVTWVLSSACKVPQCTDKNKYVPLQSTSKERPPGEFKMTYSGGLKVSGLVYADTVTTAGLSAEGLVFSAVDQIHSKSMKVNLEGILGLALKPESRLNAPNFIDTLFSQQKISRRMFSMYLSSDTGSELYIGGTNPSKYTGEITYVPLIPGYYWIIEGRANVNNQEVFKGRMLIDSGTNDICGPRNPVEKWWSMVPGSMHCSVEECGGSGYFKFPCANAPRVSFKFNEREFAVPRRDVSLGRLGNTLFCVGSIRIMDSLPDVWLLGTRFMRNVYTVFDAGALQVGFATPVISSYSTPTASHSQGQPSGTPLKHSGSG